MATVPCPNCLKPLSADLYISSRGGFSKVHLGVQCNSCQTLYKSGSALWRIIQALGELRAQASR